MLNIIEGIKKIRLKITKFSLNLGIIKIEFTTTERDEA
jgi:hypothetical protein